MSTLIPVTINQHNAFDLALAQVGDDFRGLSINTVQVNIGLTCNLACHHCHVESSPKRTEQMDRQTMDQVLDVASKVNANTIDITGGAPEMMPGFRSFTEEAIRRGFKVIVRTNLTIMQVDGYEDLPKWYADLGVHLVASLPCYLKVNVDKQRGHQVYENSVEVIKLLNEQGYGRKEHLQLDLVYNPGGPSLPPDQVSLEKDYKVELKKQFGLDFNMLYTITNVPIGRFQHDLERDGKAQAYQVMLRDAFNPETLDQLMCRHQMHISHDGYIHDCDFNYALGMTVQRDAGNHISNFDVEKFLNRRIRTGEHCFACTAGCGSSCGGSLV